MRFTKIGYITSPSIKAKSMLRSIKDKHIVYDVNKHHNIDVIVVIGGDGTMLHALHNWMFLNVPFYGINTGNVGFLLNDLLEINELIDKLNNSQLCSLYPLQMIATTTDGSQYNAIAINEVSVFRSSHQSAKFRIIVNQIERIPEIIGDGALLATPAGSSAYNFSVGGPILPLSANVLCLMPICPFRPKKWHGALLPFDSTVIFEVLEPDKRPLNAVADFHEVKDVTKVEAKISKDQEVKILFNIEYNLSDKIFKEQFNN